MSVLACSPCDSVGLRGRAEHWAGDRRPDGSVAIRGFCNKCFVTYMGFSADQDTVVLESRDEAVVWEVLDS